MVTQKRVLPVNNQQDLGEDPEKEKLSARLLKLVSFLIVGLAKFFGFIPFQYDTTTNSKTTIYFKLFSSKTISSWLRLVVITFPIYILPLILYFIFLSDEKDVSRPSGTFLEEFIFDLEYFVNFLVYLLPILFAYVSARPLSVCWNICTAENNLDIDKEKHVFKEAMVPILGLVLFFIGKAFRTIYIFSSRSGISLRSESKSHILAYCDLCVHFLIHFPLHSLLAIYEFFFYQTLNHYQLLANRLLKTQNTNTLMIRTEELTTFMENAKKAEEFFLLVDLTLMLFFWLAHTYLAYGTFQVCSSVAHHCTIRL